MKINEIFCSFQGEGRWAGIPNVFIRTTGCNLRCTFCDTKYAYEQGEEMSIEEIIKRVGEFPYSKVCITGGEPLLQTETLALIDNLLRKGYEICLETNGSINIKTLEGKSIIISLDIKCPSSMMHERMNLNNLFYLTKKDQLKFVIKNKEDYTYAKSIVRKYKPSCPVFFQPVWNTDPRALATWILEDGFHARLSLQLHKIIWGEKRGK
jgi:7-carboxy-7-deazaguanine synthase